VVVVCAGEKAATKKTTKNIRLFIPPPSADRIPP
jgi:hypothetical protein